MTVVKRITAVVTVAGAGAMMLAGAHGPAAFCPYCALRTAPAAVHQAALGCEIRGQADCGP
jgi:hypothetical protein